MQPAYSQVRLTQDQVIEGDLDLSHDTALTELPDGLRVRGTLDLSGCSNLVRLPARLHVEGNLDLSGCLNLTSLPDDMVVGSSLNLFGCSRLTALPENLTINGDLDLGATRIAALPPKLRISGELINDYGFGRQISAGVFIGGSLNFAEWDTQLSKGLTVGHLSGGSWGGDTALPEDFTVLGDLTLWLDGHWADNRGITVRLPLPKGLTVKGNLTLLRHARVPSYRLPEDLVVGGDLDLRACGEGVEVPDQLNVGGRVILSDPPLSPAS